MNRPFLFKLLQKCIFNFVSLLRRRLATLPEARLLQIKDVLVELMALMEAS